MTGTFVFSDDDPGKLEGKARAAFRAGFLGVQSLGWSTLVQIVEASEDDRLAAIETLAKQLVAHFGAPDDRRSAVPRPRRSSSSRLRSAITRTTR